MSYNGKFTSVLGVVEAAYRDSGLDFVDFENAIEWTAELMGLLGVPYVYIDKVTNGMDGSPIALTVAEYRCKLPDDLVSLNSVRKVDVTDNGEAVNYSEMLESSEIFHHSIPLSETTTNPVVWNPLVEIDEFDPATEGFVHARANYELENQPIASGAPYTYKIDHGYIFTNFRDGYVQVAYRGFPMDSAGFPMVPDDPKLREALKFHILYKIDWRNWRMNPSPQNKSLANDSEQQRDWYIAAARTKAHIPSVDKMESLKNQWLRSSPKVNEHKNGFSSLNIAEKRYNQTRRPRNGRRSVY